MELRGDAEVHEKHCPRCACDLDELIDQCTDEEYEIRKMWKEILDLCKVYKNWARGFKRVIETTGEANYSLVEEFSVEVLEQSFPYLARLMKHEHFNESMAQLIRDTVNDCTEEILKLNLEYEDLQRLTGTWDDDEQEIKEYWLKRLGFTSNLLGTIGKKPKQIKDKAEG